MSNIDFVVGAKADRLNKAISQVYQNTYLRDKLFSGSQDSDFSGQTISGKWIVEAPPELELRAPLADEWAKSIKGDGGKDVPKENAFIVNLHSLKLTIVAGGQTKQSTFPVRVICAAVTNGALLSLTARSVVVDLSGCSPIDQFFAKKILIPHVLDGVTKTVSGINIQLPSLPGAQLTPPVVSVDCGALVLAANLAMNAQPSLAVVKLPDLPFFILASQSLMKVVANYVATTNIQGQSIDKSGSAGAAGFSGDYHAYGKVYNASVYMIDSPLQLKASFDFSLNASAGINLPGGYIIEAGKVIYKEIVPIITPIIAPLNPSNW